MQAVPSARCRVRHALKRAVGAVGLLTVGCSGPLAAPMDCSKVVRLRLGQTPDQVAELIGQPPFAGEQKTVWADGTPRTDFVFIYGNGERSILPGTRDEMSVDFLHGELVEASAYRMRDGFLGHDAGRTAILLGSRDYGSRTPPFRIIGPAFKEVFDCAADFSVDRARAQFGWSADFAQ